MTYREKYQQLHPEADVSELHVDFCPDILFDNIPRFSCLFRNGDPDPNDCCACWDSEIPGMEEELPTPEKPMDDGEATTKVLVEAVGDTIHMQADGDVENLVLCALGAVHIAAKHIYDAAKDKLAAEKIIHEMQNALSPTGGIWCFDDKETD